MMRTSRGKFGAIRSPESDYANVVESRIGIVFPKLRQLLTRQGARSVLDYGGGAGQFCAEYLPKPVSIAAYFDASPNMRALARLRLGTASRVRIFGSAAEIPSAAYDAVVMTAVWMEFPTERDAVRNLRTIARALKSGGHLYAAVTHPCFREERFSTFSTDFKNQSYLQTGTRYTATVSDGRNRTRFEDTHWNLDAMSGQLLRSGFVIRRLHEMADTPGARNAGRGSPWLIIDAQACSAA
jgi:SAM-dependent methyltransferase